MNRTDRLLAIMLELRTCDFCRAEDLAEKFETCKRTIYRDMQALSESGVPLMAVPGKGYSLMEGYFLPPVHLKPEEAMTLLLGSGYIEQNLDREFQQHARTAQEKLEAVLPASQQEEVIRFKETVRFLPSTFFPKAQAYTDYENKLISLRVAIMEKRAVSFGYRKKFEQNHLQSGRRTVHPYGLVNISGIWYLLAYCLLRKDIRHFRLERMDELRCKAETFEKPDGFELQKYIPDQDRPLSVHVIFDTSVQDRVLESRYFYLHTHKVKADGLHVTLRVRQVEEVFHWLLSWGSKVKVIEPESLADRIREEAAAMLGIRQKR